MANYGDLSLLEQARAPQGNRGASALVSALSGGGDLAYQQGQMRGANLANVTMQARQRQQAEVGRQAANHEYMKNGNTLAAEMSLYANPKEVAESNAKEQNRHYQEDLWNRQNSGTVDDAKRNALLAILDGKPSTSFDIKEGLGFNPHGNPNQTPSVTPVGTARINELKSLAGEHNAQAERAHAGIGADKAANWELTPTAEGIVRVNKLTGETAPLTMNGSNVVKAPASPKAFTEHEMAAGLSAPDAPGKIDPLRFRQFENVKQENPGKGDSDVFAALRVKDAEDEAAANTGPPAELAGSGDGIMQRLYGGGAPAARAAQPPPGARQAPDGHFYVPDPNRPGKYLRVDQ